MGGGHLPGVVVDTPASRVPAEGSVVAVVDAARVVAEGIEAVDRAACDGRPSSALPWGIGTAHTTCPPTRLTRLLAGELPQVELLQREVHEDGALLDGVAGSGEPIQVWAASRKT